MTRTGRLVTSMWSHHIVSRLLGLWKVAEWLATYKPHSAMFSQSAISYAGARRYSDGAEAELDR